MKKTTPVLLFLLLSNWAFASNYNIGTSGNTYTPAMLTVKVGDQITIKANSFHPLMQVDQTTWEAKGKTALSGGWGTKTADYTFTATAAGTIYYICTAHIQLDMKGMIVVEVATEAADVKAEAQNLKVFPNPAFGMTAFTFDPLQNSLHTARIYSITGQLAKEIFHENASKAEPLRVQFNAADLPAGVYFLVVADDKRRYTRRFEVVK